MAQRLTKTAGTSPVHWSVGMLKQRYGYLHDYQVALSRRTETEKQVARNRFEQHFGEVDLAYATDVDNEQINLDLK